MTRDQLWAAYVAKNPQFAGDGNVTLSAAGLRKIFEQTWEKGREAGFENGKAWTEMRTKSTGSKSDRVSDMMRACGLG
jgi:hypothetical protein